MYFIQPVHHMILISSDKSKVKPQIIQVVHPSVQGVLFCHIEVWKLFFQWPENCFEAMTWKLETVAYVILRSLDRCVVTQLNKTLLHLVEPTTPSNEYSNSRFSDRCSLSWLSVDLFNFCWAVLSEISFWGPSVMNLVYSPQLIKLMCYIEVS